MEPIGEIQNASKVSVCKMYLSRAKSRHAYFRNHKHTDFEICCILQGKGNFRTEKANYDMEKNDIFLFSTNESHCITDIDVGDGEMVILNLHFSPNFIWSMGNDYLQNNYLEIFFNRPKEFSNRLDRENPAKENVLAILNAMQNEFQEKRADYPVAVKSMLISLLVLLHREFIPTEADGGKNESHLHFAQIQNAVDYINKNFAKPLALAELAEKAAMQKTYFCAVFKKLNGMTPWQYINLKRTEKAIDLLKHSTDTVLEIALQCGYNNTANFNKIFQSVTGVTPKHFRQK